ncbi:MAG TPA: alpha/beta fold hydrolase [Bacteriovoracaceae bacterium]|nr:alpha/beta fold hydrolase [Bacteriovoracaceae bacterium]
MIEDFKSARLRIPPCLPPIWASTGHLQTILGNLLGSPALNEKGIKLNVTLDKEEERIQTIYLKGENKTVVYLFHGLAGTADAAYMQRTAIECRKLGYHVFLNNHRGCGEGMGLAFEPYHSGRAEDLSSVIAYGRKMLPDHHHVAVGFSLSANALLLLAAGVRAEVLPDVAIAVNAPINLDEASINLTQGLNRIYNFRFMIELRRHVKRNHPETFHMVKNVWELRNFDEAYTAPIGGFKNRADYYKTCSAKQYLPGIKIPTVMLTAKDDPFVAYADYKDASISSCTLLHIEEHGGHMGYLTKEGKGYTRWLDLALREYLRTAGAQK